MNEKKIIVLHITPHLGGGIGKAVIGLSEMSLALGITTQIILLEKPEKPEIKTKAEQAGIEIIMTPDDHAFCKCVRMADVVIIDWWDHPLSCEALFKTHDDCRLVVWCHANGCVYPFLNAAFLLHFDSILFTSGYSDMNHLWDEIEKREILKKRHIIYGFGKFDPKLFCPKECYMLGTDNKLRIGYAGTLDYSKMSPHFIEYCEMIAEDIENVEFHFAGDVSESISKSINHSSHKELFCLDGYVSDMKTWYQSIDVFLYLLNSDHYGTTENVVLEAMAYGLPVILMDGLSERFISGNDEGAILVRNSDDVVRAVKRLYEDSRYRAKCGKRAYDFVLKTYSPEENVAHYYDAITALLQSEKKAHDFSELLGDGAWETFLLSTGDDRKVFERFICFGEEEALERLLCKKKIYLSKSKSSIYQFYKYFPNDKEIRKIKRIADSVLEHNSVEGGE